MRVFRWTSLLAVVFLAGCANTMQRSVPEQYALCATMGAIAGGAVTAAATSGTGALGGAATGAALALLLCEQPQEPLIEEPVVVAQSCALTPIPGATLDANGCAMDSDRDGVLDGIDQCPNTPEGVAVDAVGCPLDSDSDGVPDYRDECPGTPVGTAVDAVGCPIVTPASLTLNDIRFEFDSAQLTLDAQTKLQAAVDFLGQTLSTLSVRVEGHTDSIGTAQYNLELSQRRAESVVDFLVTQGVARNRLIPIGKGEDFPVADNQTAAGRAMNRRVEFIVQD